MKRVILDKLYWGTGPVKDGRPEGGWKVFAMDKMPQPPSWWEILMARICGRMRKVSETDANIRTVLTAWQWKGKIYLTRWEAYEYSSGQWISLRQPEKELA